MRGPITKKAARDLRNQASIRRAGTMAAVALICAGGSAEAATTVTWIGPSGVGASYVAPANWDSGTTPANASDQFLLVGTSAHNNAIAQISGANAAEGTYLNIGMTPGDTGRLEISGGTLSLGELRVGGREVGTANTFNPGGTGTVIQTGGDVNVTYSGTVGPIQSLYIGDAGGGTSGGIATANGTYNISAGTLTSGIASDDAIVVGTGVGTTGTFIHSGGTVTSTGFVTVARAGAVASYTMSGGTLNVGTGASVAGQDLRVGEGEYPTGTLTASTSGTFTQTNGTINVNRDVSVGRQRGTGSFTITGANSKIVIKNNMNVGSSGTGTFVQGTTGGLDTDEDIDIAQAVSVGISSTADLGVGTYTLKSGKLAIGTSGSGTRVMAIGNNANGQGTFIQEGGVFTSTDLLQVGRNNSSLDNLYHMTGGSSTAVRWFIGGGSGAGATAGKGTFDLDGGTVTCSENFNIAAGAAAGTSAVGLVDMSGGSLTCTAATAVMSVGNGLGANGKVLLSGGTLGVEGATAVIDVGRNNASGTLTLSGSGVLKTTQLRTPDRTAGASLRTIDFNGGSSTVTTISLDDGTMTITAGTHSIGTVTVNPDGVMNANAPVTKFAALNIAGGTTTIGANGSRVLSAGTLSITSGKLDVQDNKFITTTPVAAVSTLIQSGRGTGSWNGASGIVTSQTHATLGSLTSIGVATASQVKGIAAGATAVWAGQTVTGSDTLVMYTYGGDADLNGKINIDDYGHIDTSVGLINDGWYNGDFNYDGQINIDDYGIIDVNVGVQTLGDFFAAGAVNPISGVTAVPEPALVGWLTVGAAWMLARRRRSQVPLFASSAKT